MKQLFAIAAFCAALTSISSAQETYTLDDAAFLEGHWRGGSESFVFEEIWSPAEGGVMTGMARGVAGGTLRVLEYIIIAEEKDGLVMRFKHYNADFSTWEGEETPLTLSLEKVDGFDATFTADPPSHTVKSIRYWMRDEDTLQVDVQQIENGEEGGFSLTFEKVD